MEKRISTSRTRRLARLSSTVGGQGARELAMRAANVTRSEEQAAAALEKRQLALAERLVEMLGSMRGAAMKVGQSLSIVDFGLVPASHRDQFQRKLTALQDRAPQVPWKKMKRQVEKGMGGKLERVFAEFDEEPVGAASIGQVYRATLKDGTDVAVKVQYPGIANAVRSDMKNLRFLAPAARAVIPGIDVKAVVDEVEERVMEELDYVHEAQNHRRFARHYRNHPFIRVPAVHSELCSEFVLVTDWVDGKPMKAAEGMSDAERNRIAEIVFRFYMRAPYELRVFSADPHPGNSLIGDDGTVGFIDFGLLKRIDQATVDLEARGFRAMIEGDARTLLECMADQGIEPDPERFTPDEVVDTLWMTQGWFLADEAAELTPAITNALAAQAADMRGPVYRLFKDQDLPAAHMAQRRVEVAVLSIIGQLRPTLNFGEIYAEWLYDREPETDLGREEQLWREGAAVAAA